MEPTKFVRYFYKDEDDTASVHAEGRNHYALVGPTDATGNSIVCDAAVLVVADSGQFGKEDTFIVTRGHVLEIKRGPDFQFMYVLMSSMDHTNDGGTEE